MTNFVGISTNPAAPPLTAAAINAAFAGKQDISQIPGARFDGATDDTAAIQAEINRLAGLGLGIALPTGRSIITGLVIPPGLKYIIAPGPGLTTLQRKPNDPSISYMLAGNGLVGLILKGFTLDGNKTNQINQGAGTYFSNSYGFTVENMAFINHFGSSPNYGWGFRCDGNGGVVVNPDLTSILKCKFSGNVGDSCVIKGPYSNLLIESCSATSSSSGIAVSGSVTAPVTFVQISDCNVQGNSGVGIAIYGLTDPAYDFAGAEFFSVVGCVAANNVAYGISLEGKFGTATGNEVTGNGNYAASGAGILCNGSNVVIASNTIRNNQVFGIDAGGANALTITGNEISGTFAGSTMASGCGLDINGATNCTVRANTFYKNGIGSAGANNGSEITVTTFDGGGIYPAFPNIESHVQISENSFTLAGVNANGVFVGGGSLNVRITDNSFSGGLEKLYLSALSSTCYLRGNTAITSRGFGSQFYMLPVATLIVPDYADDIVLITSSASTISNIVTQPESDNAGHVIDVKITNPGTGYSTTGTISCAISGDGTGAAVFAYPNGQGGIGGFGFTSYGNSYTSATISITGGGGSGFVGTAVVGVNPRLSGRKLTIFNGSGATQTFSAGANIGSAVTLLANQTLKLVGFNGVWNIA